MRNRLRFALGQLASIEFQRRFCIGGTKDEYILPSEILESAVNAAEVTLAQPILSNKYNSAELSALRKFVEVSNTVARAIPEGLSWGELIENNPDWNTLRTAAQECLDALGLSVTLDELLSRS